MKKFKYVIIFLIVFVNSMFIMEMTNDLLWNYQFAHSIYKGMIPYVDFNMVITPFFPWIVSIVFRIFGSSILVFELFNSLIITLIIYLIEKNNKNYLIPLIILLSLDQGNYSIFVLLLTFIVIELEKKGNKKDILIGIVIGIMIMSKQNIGIILLLPCLIFSNKKQAFKRILGVFIIIIPILIYLIYNGALYYFIDYTFLGLFDFAQKNINIFKLNFERIFFITYFIIIFVKSFTLIIKSKFKDKELLYSFFFLSLVFPIFDLYHILIASIPLIVYFTKNVTFLKDKTQLIILVVWIVLCLARNNYNYFNDKHLMYKNVYCVNTIKNYEKVSNDIKNYQKNNRVFALGEVAYLVKILNNENVDKFDLLNYGNLGYNGEKKVIDEMNNICKKQNCVFYLLYSDEGQTSKLIINYVKDNYTKVNDIYTNNESLIK